MEAYLHNNPRIREWINQIKEEIFMVCLLTGVDSDAEFQKGCQIVEKLTSLLQEIPMLPSEFLENGVKHLLKQQLPDARVINCFPAFQATMDRMLHEGILKATDTQKLVTQSAIPVLSIVNIPYQDMEQTKPDPLALSKTKAKFDVLALINDALAQSETQAKSDILALNDALAQVDDLTHAEKLAKDDVKFESVVASIHSKTSQVFRPAKIPKQINLLKHVLLNIYPKSTVYWNQSLMGQTFLVQVEDILIYVDDPKHSCNLKKYNEEGWKVLVCSTKDLTFPRRLEREIRQIQRCVLSCSTETSNNLSVSLAT